MIDRKMQGEKKVSAEEAISGLKNGCRVFIGSGCGEPRHLIRAMVARKDLRDVAIYQLMSFTLAEYLEDPDFRRRFLPRLFFISSRMRKAVSEGNIDYLPVGISEIPSLFENNQIGLDAALIQVSPPDRQGYCSLGISVDITRSAARCSKTVIAQVNPRMPRTRGESTLHVDAIDCLVSFEEPLMESVLPLPEESITRRIGYYLAELVPDGATLQVGFGRLPFAVVRHLDQKNDLGLHTPLISETFLSLFKNGNITNQRKSFLPGKAVATMCMGSRELYDFVDDNPAFHFGPADFVNDPRVICKNDGFVSISSAAEVDLAGQVRADVKGGIYYSGLGDQASFIRGASLSRGGFSVIVLPSTSQDGERSRIVAEFSPAAGATIWGDVNFVVTEYGIAQLRGKSIYQRVMELAQITHPDFRKSLVEAARKKRYIFDKQLPPPAEDLLFLEDYKSRHILKNGQIMSVRPLLPSDEFAYRDFFYSLKEQSIYLRFFHRITAFSHEVVQQHWAGVDYRKNISLAGRIRQKGSMEIIAIGTYVGVEDDLAEVAFVVHEDFQNMGIASCLLGELERIARKNGFRGFVATMLPENRNMLHVFKKRYPHGETKVTGDGITARMPFQAG